MSGDVPLFHPSCRCQISSSDTEYLLDNQGKWIEVKITQEEKIWTEQKRKEHAAYNLRKKIDSEARRVVKL